MSDSQNLLNRLTSAEDDGRWLNEPARFECFYWHANYCWLQFAAQGDPDARYSQVSAAYFMGTGMPWMAHSELAGGFTAHVIHMHTIELACLLYKVWIIQYNVLCPLPVHIVLHSSTYGSFKMLFFLSFPSLSFRRRSDLTSHWFSWLFSLSPPVQVDLFRRPLCYLIIHRWCGVTTLQFVGIAHADHKTWSEPVGGSHGFQMDMVESFPNIQFMR